MSWISRVCVRCVCVCVCVCVSRGCPVHVVTLASVSCARSCTFCANAVHVYDVYESYTCNVHVVIVLCNVRVCVVHESWHFVSLSWFASRQVSEHAEQHSCTTFVFQTETHKLPPDNSTPSRSRLQWRCAAFLARRQSGCPQGAIL